MGVKEVSGKGIGGGEEKGDLKAVYGKRGESKRQRKE